MTQLPPHPSPVRRILIPISILVILVLAVLVLGLDFSSLVPEGDRLGILKEVLAAAFDPAVTYETPSGSQSIWPQLAAAVRATLVFAASAIGLSLVGGFVFGILASRSWWERRAIGGRGLRSKRGLALLGGLRAVLVGLRSVHELFWAVLLVAAVGLSPAAAVVAIALPYTGGLAKVFSEMLDEAPQRAADALEMTGAGTTRAYLVGIVPRAMPDLLAYTFYRFECAVRSSAVLGFFGYETLGFHFKTYFGHLDYELAWTYLYATLLLMVGLEAWSLRLRRGLVG